MSEADVRHETQLKLDFDSTLNPDRWGRYQADNIYLGYPSDAGIHGEIEEDPGSDMRPNDMAEKSRPIIRAALHEALRRVVASDHGYDLSDPEQREEFFEAFMAGPILELAIFDRDSETIIDEKLKDQEQAERNRALWESLDEADRRIDHAHELNSDRLSSARALRARKLALPKRRPGRAGPPRGELTDES